MSAFPGSPKGGSDLLRREEATRKTLEMFRERPFDWAKGGTCLHLARAQLLHMGHVPPAIPQLRSALGAKRALKRRGFADLSALLDSILPRIAPAQAWLGDLVLMDGDEGFDTIYINAGGKLLGYSERDPSGVRPMLALETPKAAWRV